MTMEFRDIAAQAAANGRIEAEEILALRRTGWVDGKITLDEAEAIFAANDRLDAPSEEWSDFFVEAIVEFVVMTQQPEGYVSEEQAEWLMARIDHDGSLDSMSELEMLVKVFERAREVPVRLREFALSQIERAVLSGEGPTRSGGALEKGNVTAAEAELVRRIIFASGSERPAAVSRTEADMLYRIKDAARGGQNAPEWKRLFVQGVGNYIAGYTRFTAISRERAVELDSFMSDHSVSLGRFIGRIAKASASGNFVDSLMQAFGGEKEGPDTPALAEQERGVSADEQVWLEGRIEANGEVDEYDRALLDFLEDESGFARD